MSYGFVGNLSSFFFDMHGAILRSFICMLGTMGSFSSMTALSSESSAPISSSSVTTSSSSELTVSELADLWEELETEQLKTRYPGIHIYIPLPRFSVFLFVPCSLPFLLGVIFLSLFLFSFLFKQRVVSTRFRFIDSVQCILFFY